MQSKKMLYFMFKVNSLICLARFLWTVYRVTISNLIENKPWDFLQRQGGGQANVVDQPSGRGNEDVDALP